MEEQAHEIIESLSLPIDWRERLEELEDQQDKEVVDLERQRSALLRRMARLRELYLDGDFTKREYQNRKAEIQRDLNDLQPLADSHVEIAGETIPT